MTRLFSDSDNLLHNQLKILIEEKLVYLLRIERIIDY